MKKLIAVFLSVIILMTSMAIMVSAKTEPDVDISMEDIKTIINDVKAPEDFFNLITTLAIYGTMDFAASGLTPGAVWLALPVGLAVVVPPIGILLFPVSLVVGVMMWLTTDFLALFGINIYG